MNVIGYARISADDEGEGHGVSRQRQDIERHCGSGGWTLVDVIIENDRGASDWSHKPRPEYERAVELLRQHAVDGIVAYSIERLTRRWDQGHELLQLGEKGAHVVGIVQGIDLATDGGRDMYGFLLTQARNESATISRRVRRAQEQSLERGRKHIGGRRLFGYNSGGPGLLVVNEDEAPWVRKMVAEAMAGRSGEAIAGMLDDAGVTTTEGGRWSSRSVRALITNPTIAGLQSKMRRIEDTHRYHPHERDILGPGSWEAIVTPEDQAVAVAALAARSVTRTSPGGRPTPFSGVLLCADCGAKMTRSAAVSGSGGKQTPYSSWKCDAKKGGCGHNSITAACEDWILDRLFESAADIAVRRRKVKPAKSRPVRPIGAVHADLEALFDIRGSISADGYRLRKERLEAELREAKAGSVMVADPAGGILDAGRLDRDMWDACNDDVKRDILRLAYPEGIRVLRIDRRAWNDAIAAERLDSPQFERIKRRLVPY
jgi:DNA invertase Pin-like site-specific DNA recombinase